MTKAEKDKLMAKALKALESGDEDTFDQILAQLPANPEYVMGMKEIFGSDVVRYTTGINLSAVEEKYGPDWYKQ